MNKTNVMAGYSEDKQKYEEKLTDLITDMGDLWDRSKREKAARALIEDYTDLSEADADKFIADNEYLFDNGKLEAHSAN
ncbi:hypothetical protein [Methylobacterium sp. E-046]|uniref:hypothetical protein n=1 Tax=Methylobacterium sp. E-046 TaxID=2836576 RepID=UPI001FBA0958|nr:hypothetical protein [Methylobacterium sp. E-046]MCJ2097498.1 hypothetical protein [Methylobacterium sp. E-046]